MMNNNHKNSGCGFADELVSHLYGETDAADNPAFEKHLATCSICADELEAFAGVHYSINDWKLKDFANLQTPVIEIPYPAATEQKEVSGAENSWLTGMRRLFTSSWSLAGVAVAAFAICVGIVLYASNSRTFNNEVAGTNKNSKIQVSPTADKPAEQANINGEKPKSQDIESTPLNKPEAPQPELTVERNTPQIRPVKTVKTTRQTPKTETTNLPKTNDAKRNDKNKNEIPPKIFDEDEEDDTLRLAEMLEEIDTVE